MIYYFIFFHFVNLIQVSFRFLSLTQTIKSRLDNITVKQIIFFRLFLSFFASEDWSRAGRSVDSYLIYCTISLITQQVPGLCFYLCEFSAVWIIFVTCSLVLYFTLLLQLNFVIQHSDRLSGKNRFEPLQNKIIKYVFILISLLT